jgi:syntaxin-binding protein 5
MFKHTSRALKEAQQPQLNFSNDLPPAHYETLGTLSLHGEISCQAYDPVQSLLAIGTKSGGIALFGAPAVSLCWQPKLGFGIKLLAFKPNTPYLAVIDIKDSLMIYDLSSLSPVTQEPTRICVTSLRGHSTCIHAPAAGHSHIFIGFREGSIDAFDVLAGKLSPYRIPNLWLAQEDMMRRSGMLDAPRKGHTPACMDIKTRRLLPCRVSRRS